MLATGESVTLTAAVRRIALINPNTSTDATTLMLASARQALPAGFSVEGRTAPRGQPLITHAAALSDAAQVMADYGVQVAAEGFDALIISGFGDPGLQALRHRVNVPVYGIAEAGIAEAAHGGRRYAIVTVTPDLHDSLLQSAKAHGSAGTLAGIRYTQAPLDDVMRTPEALEAALLQACQLAVALDGAEAIVIGGGPLARAARDIAEQLHIPVIDPVSAAIRLVTN